MKLTVEIIQGDQQYIALCPELEINCFGSNRKEATRRIKSVIDFYFESAKEMGMELKTKSHKIEDLEIIDETQSSDNQSHHEMDNEVCFYN